MKIIKVTSGLFNYGDIDFCRVIVSDGSIRLVGITKSDAAIMTKNSYYFNNLYEFSKINKLIGKSSNQEHIQIYRNLVGLKFTEKSGGWVKLKK